MISDSKSKNLGKSDGIIVWNNWYKPHFNLNIQKLHFILVL